MVGPIESLPWAQIDKKVHRSCHTFEGRGVRQAAKTGREESLKIRVQ